MADHNCFFYLRNIGGGRYLCERCCRIIKIRNGSCSRLVTGVI